MFYNYNEEKSDNPEQPETRDGQNTMSREPEPVASPAPQEPQAHGGPNNETGASNIYQAADEAQKATEPEYQSAEEGYLQETKQNAWREPSYSEAPEKAPDMYTPGLNSQQYYSRRKTEEAHAPVVERHGRRRRGGFLRAACLALACVILSGAATYGVMEYRIRNGDLTPVNQVTLGSTKPGSDYTTPIVSSGDEMIGQDIYDMACSQVVGVKTEFAGAGGYFGQQGTPAVSGSGFIISEDGYILTNYHVIETAYRGGYPIKAVLHDGTEYAARIIGFEESNDVAVIKIEATGLSAVVIGDSDNIRVGQRIYAVGNPLGELVYTMTEGIVSGLNRVVTVDNKSIETFQLSAAVNSGNSGGPVYNGRGEVIGIVTAKFMSSNVEGIGFAIPINDAISLALDLVENGYITGKAYMGISVRTFSQAYAEFFSSVEGAYVVSVTPGSAADKAGIKVGDIITKLGENDVTSEDSLLYAKNKFKAGETAPINIRRSGDDIELTITFDEDTTWAQQQQPQQSQQPQQAEQFFPLPEQPYGQENLPEGATPSPEVRVMP